jgi:glutaredoxin-related protein
MKIPRSGSQTTDRIVQIFESTYQNVNNALLILQPSARDERWSRLRDAVKLFPHVHANDEIGHPRLVFDGDERNALRGSWPLAHEHEPADADMAAIGHLCQLTGREDSQLVELFSKESNRLAPRIEQRRSRLWVLSPRGDEPPAHHF